MNHERPTHYDPNSTENDTVCEIDTMHLNAGFLHFRLINSTNIYIRRPPLYIKWYHVSPGECPVG